MSSIVIQGDTSGSITVAAPSVAGTHTLTLPKATGNIATDATVGLGMKNRIINGNMVIDQRNVGASVTQNTGIQYCLDRWSIYGTQTSKFTAQQNAGSVTPPEGFINYLGITSSSAYTLNGTDSFWVQQLIEGYNTADLDFGKSTAKTITISFWVRSSLTGTFGGVLKNSATNRSYPFNYTISSANTWEKKTITITGDTTGTWLTNNGVGLMVRFSVGSNYTATAGIWTSGYTDAPTGQTSVVGTSGATWYITGVQLEVGENATPFENRMYGTELALCQRYFYNVTGISNGAWSIGQVISATRGRMFLTHPVVMRVSPTISYTGSPYITASTGSGQSITSISANYGGATSTMLDANVASGLSAGNACISALSTTTDMILASAEL